MQNLTLYCNCFRNHPHRASQFDQRNLMCGASGLSDEEKQWLQSQGYWFDDSGDNISNFNRYLGDLTGLYWVWKNTTDSLVGTNQYRRMWDTDHIKSLQIDPDTLYILQRVQFDQSAYNQYVHWHGQWGMDLLQSSTGRQLMDPTHTDQLKHIDYLHCNNMFFAARPLFDQVCAKLFDIVLPLYHSVAHVLPTAPANQTRTLAFLAERILTLMFVNSNHYFGSAVRVKEIGWSYDPKK